MAVWTSSMLKNPPQTEDVAELVVYLKTTINQVAVMLKELDYVLNGNLDIKNLRANSITAKYLDVDKLSAISADIGEVTAGIIRGISIYGSYIATREGTYPRTELSTTGDLLRAYYDANNYVAVEPSYSGSPAFVQQAVGNVAVQKTTSSEASYTTDKDLYITSNTGDIRLNPDMGNVVLYSFDTLYGTFDGKSLGTALSELSDRITALGG